MDRLPQVTGWFEHQTLWAPGKLLTVGSPPQNGHGSNPACASSLDLIDSMIALLQWVSLHYNNT
jgi:hypothetical protein